MQTLQEQKKDLEEQIANKQKAIDEAEQSLSVSKALMKQDKKKLEILTDALSEPAGLINNPVPYALPKENALSKDKPETR